MILSIIPILGLSFFLIEILIQNSNKLNEMSEIRFTIKNVHLIHDIYVSLEKERLGLIRIANSKYLNNIDDIMLIPNIYIINNETNKKFEWFYKQRTLTNLPIIFIQALESELIEIRNTNTKENVNSAEINRLYSVLISKFISVIESMLSVSNIDDIKLYLNAMKYQELSSREIASLDDVFLSGRINKDNFSDYLFKYSMRQNVLNRIKFQLENTENSPKFVDKLKEINELSIDNYSNLIITKVDKILIVSQIKSVLGYSGLFHDFYMYKTKQIDKDKESFLRHLGRLEMLVDKYKLFKPYNNEENKILDDVLDTVYTYKAKLDSKDFHINSYSIDEKNISILDSINNLDSGIYGVKYESWHEKSQKFEDLNNELYKVIGNLILVNISKNISLIESKNKSQLVLFCILLIGSILFSYLVHKNILEKIVYFESKFNDFLMFVKGESIKTVSDGIVGNDEFSLMLWKLDNDIKFVEEKINDEKSFIKNASIKLSNIKNGKFGESLNYQGDNPLITELSFVVDNFSKNLERIVVNINTAFLELSSGNFKHRMKLYCQGEFLLMKNSLNTTLDKFENLNVDQNLQITNAITEIQKKDQLLSQQSKHAAMGEMVGSIAHQWRQPLNALAGNIQMLTYDYEDELVNENYTQEFVKDNMNLISYMSKTIDDFRNFFRVDKAKKEFNVKSTIHAVLNLLSAQLKDHEIFIEIIGYEHCVLLGLESEFQQVILNIISNAKDEFVKKNNHKAVIRIDIQEDQSFIVIKISDNAGGIPNEIIDRVFEPYFTSKEQGKGTGLGLYMSKMIIEENMDGHISAYNHLDGAVFDIRFKNSQG